MKNNNNDKVTLGVAETNPKFVGRGMALVDPKVVEDLGLSTGEVITSGLYPYLNHRKENAKGQESDTEVSFD